MVFNATFNNISVISWRSVLLVPSIWFLRLLREIIMCDSIYFFWHIWNYFKNHGLRYNKKHFFLYSISHVLKLVAITRSNFLFSFRPVSAYALFFRDTQAAIKGQSPNASFGEVSKIVAQMWDGLDPEHKNVSILFLDTLSKLQ